MNSFYFKSGLEYTLYGNIFAMHSNFEDGWQIEEKSSGRISFIKTDELLKQFCTGSLKFNIPRDGRLKRTSNNQLIDEVLSDLDAITQHEIIIKRDFIRYFNKHYSTCTLDCIEIAINAFWKGNEKGKPPSASTAYRWIAKFRAAGEDILSLLSKASNRGGRSPKLNKETIDLCLNTIHKFYLNKNRISVERVYEHIQVQLDRDNLTKTITEKHKLPSISTVRRLIAKLNKYDVAKARYGKNYADLKFHVVTDQTPAFHINSRWEIDHTPMDVIALDDEFKSVIGRPFLTTVVDVYSRCVLAAYISFEEATATRVLNALKEAILNKHNILEKYPSIRSEWPCHGLPDVLVTDRGLEFLGNRLESFCVALSIHSPLARARHGNDKGTIERTAGYLNKRVTEELPGKTFSSIQEKGHGYNPTKFAMVPLSALKKAMYEFVCDVHHQSIHRTTGKKPVDKWKQNLALTNIRFPVSEEQLDLNIFIDATRKLTNKGIELNNLPYSSKDLERLIRSIGYIEVTVKWNPEDLGYIYICLDGGGHLKVPLNKIYFHYGNGLSLKVHNMLRKQMPKGNSPEQALELAKRKDQILNDMLQESSKKKSRISKKDLQVITNLKESTIKKIDVDNHSEDLPRLDDFYEDELPELEVLK